MSSVRVFHSMTVFTKNEPVYWSVLEGDTLKRLLLLLVFIECCEFCTPRFVPLFLLATVRKASAGRAGTRPFAILYSVFSLSCLRRSSNGGSSRKSSILPMHPGSRDL